MKLHYPAQWLDGRSAAVQTVDVWTHVDDLVIQDEQHQRLASWPLNQIRCTDEYYSGQPLRLHNPATPDARLIIHDQALISWLCGRIPGFHGARNRKALGLRLAMAIPVLVLISVAAIYAIPRASAPLAQLIPSTWEQRLGAHIVNWIVDEDARCEKAPGHAALNALTQRLTAEQEAATAIRIHVIKEPSINALAAPGGHIIVFSGLLEFAETPEELAAVLAHELAHVRERHVMQGLIRDLGLSLVVSALVGDLSTLAGLAADAGHVLFKLSYSRELEQQADALAYASLQQAGISGTGMQAFFERLSHSHTQAPELFSTHPHAAQRAQAFADLQGGPALSPEQWQAVQNMCTQNQSISG